jgi:hypothetical protein
MTEDNYSLLPQYRDLSHCWDKLRKRDAALKERDQEIAELQARIAELEAPSELLDEVRRLEVISHGGDECWLHLRPDRSGLGHGLVSIHITEKPMVEAYRAWFEAVKALRAKAAPDAKLWLDDYDTKRPLTPRLQSTGRYTPPKRK